MAASQARLIDGATQATKTPMTAQRPIRTGVVGCGFFGGLHVQKYAANQFANLVGIFDQAADRAQSVAEQNETMRFDDLDQLLSNVDAVSITTPAVSHFDTARRALERGVHVLVEKPIALDLDHADALIRLADESNLVLQVGHQERYVFREFGLLDRKIAPKNLRARRLGPFTGRATDVSVIFDLMVHDLDLLHQINASPVTDVTARARQTHSDHPDEVTAHLVMGDGCTVELVASRIHTDKVRDMRLDYADGTIDIDFMKRTLENSTGETLTSPFSDEGASNHIMLDPLGYGIGLFVETVRCGGEPHVTGQCGRRALATALQITESLIYD